MVTYYFNEFYILISENSVIICNVYNQEQKNTIKFLEELSKISNILQTFSLFTCKFQEFFQCTIPMIRICEMYIEYS